MAKASGGTRSSNGNFNLIGGGNDAEITDNIRDYYMSNNVRSKINEISNLKTFNDLKDYFKKQGIELTTDLQSLKDKANDEIPVAKVCYCRRNIQRYIWERCFIKIKENQYVC